MSRRALFVSYAFPPVGGAGVQRVVKFTKYLPACGWSVSVLTVANPSVPVTDDSLSGDVPAETIVRRARTLEPGYSFKAAVAAGDHAGGRGRGAAGRLTKSAVRRLTTLLLQPDPQVLWMPGAVREGVRLLREHPHEVVVATGPPFSSFLIGAALARRSGLPLVLDYRDEWGISNTYLENKRLGPFSRGLQARMQRRVVRAAGALVATTRSSALALEAVRDAAGGRAGVSWIYNGYDPDDFPPAPAPPEGGAGPYRLAYVGTLWNLTSVAPLVEAVRLLSRERPDLAARLELVFAGRRTAPQQQTLDGLKGLPCRVTEHAYLDHTEAVGLLRSAGGLCALLSDVPHAGRVVPAKIFEYMAARRPILAVAPPGELWDLLRGYPDAYTIEPGDVAGLADRLRREILRHAGGGPPRASGWPEGRFDRPGQARQLAEILETLAPA